MKKTILLLAVIFIFSITCFCQNNEEVIKTSEDIFISKDGITSSKYNANDRITYYCTNIHEDSSLFTKDTLVLVKTPINDNPPMLVLNKDSKFNFTYNIDFKTVKRRDDQTGDMIETAVDNSKQVHGRWKSNDIHKAITFTLNDQSTVNYSIKEEGEFIYFIKVPQ